MDVDKFICDIFLIYDVIQNHRKKIEVILFFDIARIEYQLCIKEYSSVNFMSNGLSKKIVNLVA